MTLPGKTKHTSWKSVTLTITRLLTSLVLSEFTNKPANSYGYLQIGVATAMQPMRRL